MNHPSREWETYDLSAVQVQVTFLTSESVVLVSTNQKIINDIKKLENGVWMKNIPPCVFQDRQH
jgi:hypothetical protein